MAGASTGVVRKLLGELREEVAAARARDPAARGVSTLEILAGWPGIHALLAHRAAHAMHERGVPLLPRMLALVARAATGIEIHPAAQIGRGLFIDHGAGVVVGETARIGDNVTLYQGVTLGGTGSATGKRHPTVEDNVTIGSGAKLLGPVVIGHGAKVGANTTVVGNPGHPVRVEGRRPEGPDTDWIHLPDPIAEAIEELAARIATLERASGEHGNGSGGRAEPPPRIPRAQGRDPVGG
ncbi:MAG: serine O-acetyltransferase EpsC [Solirubrobacteraceae bacterium]